MARSAELSERPRPFDAGIVGIHNGDSHPPNAAADLWNLDLSETGTIDTLVSLAAVTWDFPLVGRTRMLNEAWATAGQRAVFVQVPSYRTALERLWTRNRSDNGIQIVRPWPTLPSRWWSSLSERRLRIAIRSRARGLRRQLDSCIDFRRSAALVVSPLWTPWLDELPFRRVIYDCIDDVSVHVPRTELKSLYRRWEDELIDRVDAAVVSAESLRDSIAARRPDLPIATIRNGVDADAFDRAARSLPRPVDVPDAGRPIIGFVGALYDWIDWRLIDRAAAEMPECDFVFVGPHRQGGEAGRLAQRANVRFLGARPYASIPSYMAAFDVCWVPFDQSRVSRSANPVKIYEYLALGKPVVTTPVAGTESFGDLVRVGMTGDEVVEHLRLALGERECGIDKRIRFARVNSWSARAAAYVSFVRTLSDEPLSVAVEGSVQ